MSSRSPSKIRYDETHPNVSFRLPEDVKEWLDSVRGNASYTEIIRNAMLNGARVQEALNAAYGKGYEKGYEDARRKYQLTFWCSVCRKAIDCPPDSEMHRFLVQAALYNRWGHIECHERQRRGQQTV
jgi:hypothetical protein